MVFERDHILVDLESTKIRAEEFARARDEEAEGRRVERALREKAEAQKRQLEAKIENLGKLHARDSVMHYVGPSVICDPHLC